MSRLRFVAFFVMLFCLNSLNAQQSSVSDTINHQDQDPEELEMEKVDYRGMIGSQYLQRFSDFSDLLSEKELQIERIENRISRLQNSIRREQDKKRKKNLNTNLKATKKILVHHEEQAKLIRQALKLLQLNKANHDPAKLNILNEVNHIESQILINEENHSNSSQSSSYEQFVVEERDPYIQPQQEKCELAYNGYDEKTKKRRKETKKEFFFGHTHPKLKPYFKENHFLTCESQVVQVNNRYFLMLNISIRSKDALKNYGFIDKNDPLKITLINGDALYPRIAQRTLGKLEAYTGNTNYDLIIPLDKTNTNLLSKSEIDRIGIMWSSGYEEYEIYEVDRIQTQIDCLKKS